MSRYWSANAPTARKRSESSAATSWGSRDNWRARARNSRSWRANRRVLAAARISPGQKSGDNPARISRILSSCSGARRRRNPASGSSRSSPSAKPWSVVTRGETCARSRRSVIWRRSSCAWAREVATTTCRSNEDPDPIWATTASTSVSVLPVPGPPEMTATGWGSLITARCCAVKAGRMKPGAVTSSHFCMSRSNQAPLTIRDQFGRRCGS